MFPPIMRRVWAAIATAVAIIVVFTVLAFAHRPPTSSTTGTGHVVWVRSDDGGLVPVTVGSGGTHATTQTSPAAGGSAVVNGAQPTAVNTASHPTTQTS